jgi:hypothetical protein
MLLTFSVPSGAFKCPVCDIGTWKKKSLKAEL